ncbi:MAG: hypothetical protein AAFZ63_01565 [Bacteroidota bacterium]
MKRLHHLSGLLLSAFIGLHLLNHLSSIWGADYHIALMDNLRYFYRNPIIETLILAAVLIQISSGLRLFFSRKQFTHNRYQRLQHWTGLYMAVFFLIHVGAVLVGRYILSLDANFYFGVAGLNTFPLNLFFVPYYGLAIMAFFGHVAAIHYQKMKRKVLGISVRQQAHLILCFGFLVTIITLYGLTNGFAGVAIPEEYRLGF